MDRMVDTKRVSERQCGRERRGEGGMEKEGITYAGRAYCSTAFNPQMNLTSHDKVSAPSNSSFTMCGLISISHAETSKTCH